MTFPTPRRFPRTLSDAFRRPPAPGPISGPYTRPARRWARAAGEAALWAAGVGLLAAMIFGPSTLRVMGVVTLRQPDDLLAREFDHIIAIAISSGGKS